MRIRTIALVAHDNCKRDLIEWVRFNRGTLEKYRLVCTGTTGRLVQEALEEDGQKDLNITRLKSGPLGGDQQLGALIAEEVIDMIVFFWDPMQPQRPCCASPTSTMSPRPTTAARPISSSPRPFSRRTTTGRYATIPDISTAN